MSALISLNTEDQFLDTGGGENKESRFNIAGGWARIEIGFSDESGG